MQIFKINLTIQNKMWYNKMRSLFGIYKIKFPQRVILGYILKFYQECDKGKKTILN